RMKSLRMGPPLDKDIDIGAIVARVQLERIQRLVEQGVAEEATCWQPSIPLPSRGLYFPPTLLCNVHPASAVAQQEIFGPVLAAMTFRTPREAVELANNTVYGLAACVWSESINVSLHVAAQLKAEGWGQAPAHSRAQVLYYVAENLSQRREEIAGRLSSVVGKRQAEAEVSLGIERIFSYAAWADKYDGAVHNPPFHNVALAIKEPIGTVGLICPADAPLL